MNTIDIPIDLRCKFAPFIFCLFVFSIAVTVDAQTTFEIDGKAIIRDMPVSDTASNIVVKLTDGTLAIRSVGSLHSLSTSIDTITTYDPNDPDGSLSLIVHYTDGSVDTLVSVLQKGATGSRGPQGSAGVGIAQTLFLDTDQLILSNGGGSVLIDTSNLNELQMISRKGLIVTLSDGGSFRDSVLSESAVDAMVSNNNYLTSFTEVDGDVTNELQNISRKGLLVTLSDGGSFRDSVLSESAVDAMVSNNNYLTSFIEVDGDVTNELQMISRKGLIVTLSDGGSFRDSVLSESAVDAMVSNNNYLTSFTEVDGDVTNELQNISRKGLIVTLSNGGSFRDSVLSESAVDAMVSNNNYLTSFTEVDGDVTNELQMISREGLIVTLSDGGSFRDSVLSESAVDAMVSNNNYLTEEMDASPTNEIQDIDLFELSDHQLSISLTSDADEYKVDLSRYLDNTDTKLSREEVQDSAGTLVSDNIEELIEVVYNDENDRMDFWVENDLSLYDNSVSQFLKSEQDGSPTNELISSLSINGDSLRIVEGENSAIAVSLTDIKGGTRQATGTNDFNIRSHDEGPIAGHGRGEHTVDLQTLRTEAEQVAGSFGSVISGGIGNQITATGSGSAIGGGQWNTINAANAVVPGGTQLIANSYGETVIGYANQPAETADPLHKIDTDRLFTIGNGANHHSRSNAMVVLKNGNTGLGTSNPESTLHVDGGFTYIDGNQAEGKVLVSDKNGVASWKDLSISFVGAQKSHIVSEDSQQMAEMDYAEVRDQLSLQKEINQKLQAQLQDQQKQIDLLKSLIMKKDNASLD